MSPRLAILTLALCLTLVALPASARPYTDAGVRVPQVSAANSDAEPRVPGAVALLVMVLGAALVGTAVWKLERS